jgi:RNA polymerase sigma-70 factor
MPADQPNPKAPSLLADRKAFSILIRQHHRELLVYARALTGNHEAAQDIVQDSFVTAYRKIDDFDLTRDFGAWMRGFVRNKHREWRRKENRQPLPSDNIENLDRTVATWQENRVAGESSVFEVLETCLGKLPDPLNTAVDSFYLHSQPGANAAGDLEITEASLRKRLQRARAQLRDCLSKNLARPLHPISNTTSPSSNS